MESIFSVTLSYTHRLRQKASFHQSNNSLSLSCFNVSICLLHELPILSIPLHGTETNGEHLKRVKRAVKAFDAEFTQMVHFPKEASLHPCLMMGSKWFLRPSDAAVEVVAKNLMVALSVTGIYHKRHDRVSCWLNTIACQFDPNVR